ncbi:disease resistance protein RGA3 [Pyrus ussuriensis x Pyrus communis]|uniref:Disease resistance protein RGA3 n=1 Tax=Pyrus ussuriensis x Pyrus communis TaxID=2448454 RepID=A0A5N5GWY4_9ROSA|nr:disease resistance protein RGA3 [Pyrus ussuriensis x Pyrus communis]
MVDMLDKWNTYILRQHVEKQEREGENALVPKTRSSVSPSCFCFDKVRRVILRRDIALKIKDLNGKLSAIDEQRKMYEFQTIFAAMYCILFGIVAAVGIISIQFANNSSLRNIHVLGLSLFLGISISQYFVSTTSPNGVGPVKILK